MTAPSTPNTKPIIASFPNPCDEDGSCELCSVAFEVGKRDEVGVEVLLVEGDPLVEVLARGTVITEILDGVGSAECATEEATSFSQVTVSP